MKCASWYHSGAPGKPPLLATCISAPKRHSFGVVTIRPDKRSLLLGGGLLVLLTLGGWVTIKGSDGLPGFFRQDSETSGVEPAKIDRKHDESRSRPKRSREDIQRLAERWYQEILEKHPEMKVSFKDVPDERNGFLQFLNFMERFGKWGSDGLPLPENISAILNGSAPWDASAMAYWLEENRALVDEIKEIGLLEEQSVKGIDMQRTMFFSGRLANECSKLLLADARLAMERGDEAAALQGVQAVFGLADHLERIEMPSLLSETVSILMRVNARKAILGQILGAEGGTSADLAAWQGLLAGDSETPADLAEVFFGEWHHTVRSYLLPGLLGDPDCSQMIMDSSKAEPGTNGEIRDPDAVVEAHLRYFSSLVAQMKTAELAELPGLSANPPDKTGVSQNGAVILDVLFVGSSAWSKGWTRSQTDKALYQAALLAANGGELPLEPYTGKPFVIDHEAGTVSLPKDPWLESLNYQPVKIPALKQR